MSAKNKNAHTMISWYEKLFSEKYGRKPIINRYKEMWGLKAVVEHIGLEDSKSLMEYYFKTTKQGHPLDFFIGNYDKLIQSKNLSDADRLARKRIMNQTRKLVEGERWQT